MLNEQHRMDVMSNNLANANTVGFKKEGTTQQAFDSVLAYRIKDETDGVDAAQLGGISLGVKIGENYTDYSQGSMRVTDNTYDVAINGNGFFTIDVLDANGDSSVKYTRDGSFTVNKDGYLVTSGGDYVLGRNGSRIRLDPNTDSQIDEYGNITQDGTTVGTLQITDFADYNYLEKFGNNYLQPVDGAETIQAEGKVYQGYLEASNIEVVSEMVQMINISRAYESNQKMIQTFDSTLEIAVSKLGTV